MSVLKRVRVIKKVQDGGAWRFVSLKRVGKRYGWDPRPGAYYLEWCDGGQRLREVAGDRPSQAIAAQHRKQLSLAGSSAEAAARLHIAQKPNSSTTTPMPNSCSSRISRRIPLTNPRPCAGTPRCSIILSG